ncbi:MAG TPA: energy transducer TonB [Vicinamibacteria bacterium]|nr:energy transducer TonB [Vicinamibacteria bacterium]
MQRFNQRQGFLVSAILHLTILMILISRPPSPVRNPDEIDPRTLERRDVVLLSPSQLRQLLPQPRRPATPAPTPAPAPTPPPSQAKDRISVGPPSDVRQKGPMILRREDDLTKAPKGEMSPALAAPQLPVAPTPATAETAEKAAGVAQRPGRQGLRLPPGLLGQQPRGEEGVRPLPGPIGPSIEGAVEGVTRRAQRESRAGIPTGTGQNLGGLYFDPQGADFTLWITRFKDEVYRNWIVPQAALFGAARGHVDFEFTVDRDGSMSSLRLLKSSGTASLDRAAQNALTSSRMLPLPDDYGPPRVTMTVTFFYNEAPQGS